MANHYPTEFQDDAVRVAFLANLQRGYEGPCLTNAYPDADHDDLVLQNFTTYRANQFWFTDITEYPMKVGKQSMCSFEKASCS
jgi:hypothetical protein